MFDHRDIHHVWANAASVTAAILAFKVLFVLPRHIGDRVEQANVADGQLGRPDEYFGPVSARPEDLGQVREVELSPVRMFYDLEAKVKPGDRVTLVRFATVCPRISCAAPGYG